MRLCVANEHNQRSSSKKRGLEAHVIGKFRLCWIQRLSVVPSLPPASAVSLCDLIVLSSWASPMIFHLPQRKEGSQIIFPQSRKSQISKHPYIRVWQSDQLGHVLILGSITGSKKIGLYSWSGLGHMPIPMTGEAGRQGQLLEEEGGKGC